MDESESQGKVKVVDRRWFTAEGDLRDPGLAPPAPGPPPPVESAAGAPPRVENQAPTPRPAEADAPPATEVPAADVLHADSQPGFVELVDSLAQPAAAFLSGQVPGRGRDLGAARYYIDLLAVLERKSRGNLSLEEKGFLDDVLYQLRMAASR